MGALDVTGEGSRPGGMRSLCHRGTEKFRTDAVAGFITQCKTFVGFKVGLGRTV